MSHGRYMLPIPAFEEGRFKKDVTALRSGEKTVTMKLVSKVGMFLEITFKEKPQTKEDGDEQSHSGPAGSEPTGGYGSS